MRVRNILLLGALGGAAYFYRDTIRRRWQGMTAHSQMYGGKGSTAPSPETQTPRTAYGSTYGPVDTGASPSGTTSGLGGTSYGPGTL